MLRPTLYFGCIKIAIFKRKRLVWMTPVSKKQIFWLLKYPKVLSKELGFNETVTYS